MKWSKLLAPKAVVLLTAAILTLSAPIAVSNPAQAAGALQTDRVRVALFIDAAKYSLVEPVITLSSAGGLDLGVRGAGTGADAKIWTNFANNATIRASLDQYSVLLLETADFTAAKALYAKLSSTPSRGYILSRVKKGKTVYQVYTGSFTTKDAAEGAKTQTLKDSAIAAMIKSGTPMLTGPLHWSTGAYASEEAAAQQAGVYAQAGLNADVALQEDAGGKLAYAVWVGAEATTELLNAVKQLALQAAPNVPLQTANTKAAYMLKRADATASANGSATVPHFAVGSGDQKTWIHPRTDGITVKERAERSYRGDMELSAYRDKLALINELPMEAYLYAVLGSELGSSWPAEALKAQAVAARTYALKQGNKYEIAQVTDSTADQAYYGMQREFAGAVQAVDATKGEVIKDKNGLISPVFSSNAGGMTADPSEVWGNPAAYLQSVSSPDDGAEKGKAAWYRVQLNNGKVGYVHSMYVKDTGQKNKDGGAYYEATESGVNVRLAPYVDNAANPSFDQLAAKDRVVILGQAIESNAYSWVRGPYDAEDLRSKLKAAGVTVTGDSLSLEISKRGPSGRVTELKANGTVVSVPYPDALRSVFGGLPSTRFEIEQVGSYTGDTRGSANLAIAGGEGSGSGNNALSAVYVLSGGQSQSISVKKVDLTALGASGTAAPNNAPTGEQSPNTGPVSGKQFIFKGTGSGHGLGMSQWGAKGYAELGYDYKKILQTYYAGVSITKE